MSYILFARWFGLISTILALGILSNLKDAREMAKGMIKTETGYIMGGVLPVIFGTLAFMHHNVFALEPQLVVTLIGMAMILLGCYRCFFVNHWKKTIERNLGAVPPLFALFGLMFGVLLLYVGFLAPAIR